MFEIMKSVVAKNKGRASPSSLDSVEAELYTNVREYIANAREKVYLAFPNVHACVNN